MPDTNVDRWRQRGQIAMWTETNSASWNFCADAVGCDSVARLLQLMESAKWTSKASLKLTRPTMTANGDPAQFRFANKMTIAFPKGRAAEEHWSLSGKRELAFEFGLQRLFEFKSGVEERGHWGVEERGHCTYWELGVEERGHCTY